MGKRLVNIDVMSDEEISALPCGQRVEAMTGGCQGSFIGTTPSTVFVLWDTDRGPAASKSEFSEYVSRLTERFHDLRVNEYKPHRPACWTYSVEAVMCGRSLDSVRVDRSERARGERPSPYGAAGTWAEVKDVLRSMARCHYWGEDAAALVREVGGLTATIFDEWVPQDDGDGNHRRCDFWVWEPNESLAMLG